MNKMDKMLGFEIYKEEANIRFIKELYRECLEDDNKWFFGFYGDHVKVRISRESEKKLACYLEKIEVDYDIKKYNLETECGKIVGRYFERFVASWHSMAVLIAGSDGDERDAINERLIHLLMNMNNLEYHEEGYYLLDYAKNRIYLGGKLDGKEEAENETSI